MPPKLKHPFIIEIDQVERADPTRGAFEARVIDQETDLVVHTVRRARSEMDARVLATMWIRDQEGL